EELRAHRSSRWPADSVRHIQHVLSRRPRAHAAGAAARAGRARDGDRVTRARRALAGAILGAAGCVAVTIGQTATGTLDGSVVETSCGAIPGATITARQLAGDVTRTGVTSGSGRFSIDGLPAGDYAITATLNGFTSATRRAAYLRPGDTVSSSLVLVDPSRGAVRSPRTCVPIEASRGVMLVHATLNDVPDPVWLILDSGASVSVVAEALANARGIPIRTTGETRAGIGEGASRI